MTFFIKQKASSLILNTVDIRKWIVLHDVNIMASQNRASCLRCTMLNKNVGVKRAYKVLKVRRPALICVMTITRLSYVQVFMYEISSINSYMLGKGSRIMKGEII